MLNIFDSMCILLAKAEQKHFLYTKKQLEAGKLAVSPGQSVILYSLYKKDNISISELSKNVFLDNSTLTGLIDRMERSELVRREGAPYDRRAYHIVLTEKAKDLKEDLLNALSDIEKEMLKNCDETEINIFRNVLKKIFTNFDM
ncbi:Transcriptional regulator SlyA [Sporomusa termitida]|uniref:Transcriptional regulator SlyA n=1 Tax=Sporomusa termitida TaxID=2377 RepID=A0A517DWV3_9FIRM|nr:Transcriptional regulator SlyA [Sporomusa termitida]